MKTTTQTEQTERARKIHHTALEALCTTNTPGLTLWRKLRRLEKEANDAATAQCNGSPYKLQPYREDFQWEAYKGRVAATVKSILGKLPVGFFVNGDPRGYALKINPEVKGAVVPEGMHTDLGRYGILAPEIN